MLTDTRYRLKGTADRVPGTFLVFRDNQIQDDEHSITLRLKRFHRNEVLRIRLTTAEAEELANSLQSLIKRGSDE